MHEDWLPLPDRSAERDQDRHRQRIRAAVQENLRALVVEEALVGVEGAHRRFAAIRSLRLARFRYATDLACDCAGDGTGAGTGEGAGDSPSDVQIEAVHDEVARALARRWRLPEALSPNPGTVQAPSSRDLLRTRGQWACLDRRRSLRNALARDPGEARPVLRGEDLRFRVSDEMPRPMANCLVVAIRDASGSMGEEKKYLCRSFFHWLAAFIRDQYQSVGMRFICHHTEAQVVDEEEFFHRAESGGTKVSSAYRLALDAARDADARGTNVLVLHFTDGDNWGEGDNRAAREIAELMLRHVRLLAYVEVRTHGRPSGLGTALSQIQHPHFRQLRVGDREGVLGALDALFGGRDAR